MSSADNDVYLQQFIDAKTDDARLALGLTILREAWREADSAGLLGWTTEIREYIVALESGEGLNRPL